jgi:predicted ferric reductase
MVRKRRRSGQPAAVPPPHRNFRLVAGAGAPYYAIHRRLKPPGLPRSARGLDARELTQLCALLATTILIVTSLWRVSMGLQYESWRLLHGGLSLLVVAGGLTHALLVDHHSAGLVTKLALSAVIAFPLALLVESRLLRPWRLKRRPWKVVQVESRRAQSTSIILEAKGIPV